MALREELIGEVGAIFRSRWTEQVANRIPGPEDLRLGNHAKDLRSATVLYADLNGSTRMVDNMSWSFSAEVYKTYLRCAARLVRSEGGEITAYDGDRVMALFTGNFKNTRSVRAAMKIHHAVKTVINPELRAFYTGTSYEVKHVVAVDTSQLRAARIGVRGFNDLVWIGRAANYAAKLTTLDETPLWITGEVYDAMTDDVKIHRHTKQNMWSERQWVAMNDMRIFCGDTSYVF
jgi:class 3 adenylate cyclase